MTEPTAVLFVITVVLLALWTAIQGLRLLASLVGKHKHAPQVGGYDRGHDGGDARGPLPLPAPQVVNDALSSCDLVPHILCQSKPHALIIGYTGGGKSVLLRGLVNEARKGGDAVVAIDPDSAQRHYPDGVQLVRDDEQWLPALRGVMVVFGERNKAFEQGTEQFPTLWVAADECQEVLSIPEAQTIFNRLIRRGRKLGIRVLLAVQDAQVKTLALQGQSALLANLSRVEVRRDGDTRKATIDKGLVFHVPSLPDSYDGVPPSAPYVSFVANTEPGISEKEQRIQTLAEERRDLSANEILDMVGVNRNRGLALIRNVREAVVNSESMPERKEEGGASSTR